MYAPFSHQNQYLSPKRSSRLLSLLDVSPIVISHSKYLEANLRTLDFSITSSSSQSSKIEGSDSKRSSQEAQTTEVNDFLHRLNIIDESNGTVKSLLKTHDILEPYENMALKHGHALMKENLDDSSSARPLWLRALVSKLDALRSLRRWRPLGSLNTGVRIHIDESDQEIEKASRSSELKSWLNSFGAGFWAGTFARTSTAPLDRLKFIYQLRYKGLDKPPSLLTGLKQVYMQDGFRGMFRGNLVCCLKASPETSIRLTLFEKLKSMIKDEKTGTLSKGKLFLAGGFSGLVANAAIFPMDVLRTRLAAAPTGLYNGIFDAVRKIARTEGAIRPFYRGIHAAMIANLPTSGLNLMLYETLKEEVIMKRSLERPPAVLYMALAGVSAFVTCSVVYPLQFVTSRLIMADKGNQRKGMVQQIRSIYASEGMRGFYKGYCPCTSKVILGSAVSFGCFEILKRALGIEFKKH